MHCNLCQEQGRISKAIYWCQDCKEALCEPCNNFHKTFKLSKNHIVTQYEDHKAKSESNSSTSDEPVPVDDFSFCSEHPDKPLKYFCKIHEKPVCLICKRQYHRDDCDVENIEDAITETTISSVSERILSNIDEQITSANEIKSIKEDSLTKNEQLFDTARLSLKLTREQINDCFDELEKDVLQKIEIKKDLELSLLQNDVKNLTVFAEKLSKQREEVLSEQRSGNIDATKRYLKLIDIEKRHKVIFDSNPIELPITSRELELPTLKYRKLPNGIEISIINGDSQDNRLGIETNVEALEVGSSVVELEELPPSRPGTDHVLYDPAPLNRHEDITAKPKPETKTPPRFGERQSRGNAELQSYGNEDRQSRRNEGCQSQSRAFDEHGRGGGHQSCGYGGFQLHNEGFGANNLSQKSFRFKSSFTIEGTDRRTNITDIKLMPNGMDIAIAEGSRQRLWLYTKLGKKIGYLNLGGDTDSIAVIDDRRIAISLNHKHEIAVVDPYSMVRIKSIHTGEDVKGLVCFNGNLYANYCDRALVCMTPSGRELWTDKNLKGELYFFIDNDGNLFSAKMDTKGIVVYNINTKRKSKYFLKGLESPFGLTKDKEGNVLVSCNDSDKIFMKASIRSSAVVLLDSSDGIDSPGSIHYDKVNKELFVVNGDSIAVFTDTRF